MGVLALGKTYRPCPVRGMGFPQNRQGLSAQRDDVIGAGLGDAVTPFRRFKVDVGPFGLPELARAHEHQGASFKAHSTGKVPW